MTRLLQLGKRGLDLVKVPPMVVAECPQRNHGLLHLPPRVSLSSTVLLLPISASAT